MRITESEYLEYRDIYYGYCTNCQDWTRDMTEPDAEDYDCPDCECHTVVGADTALISGLIDIA